MATGCCNVHTSGSGPSRFVEPRESLPEQDRFGEGLDALLDGFAAQARLVTSAPMPLEFGAKVRRIPVYPAADGYASEGPVAKLASNESAYPPIPEVVEAVTKVLSGVNRYPDPTNSALRTRLSDRYGVPANRIAVGNGSCDILLAAGDALLEPGAEVVYAWPSFSVYPHLAAASGATRHRGPAGRRPQARPGRGCARRSPSPRGSSSSATRTTRPRPRCRSRTSRRSSPTSRRTSR